LRRYRAPPREPPFSATTARRSITCGRTRNFEFTPTDLSEGAPGKARGRPRALAPLKLESCPCAFQGEARCLAGQCTLCAAGSTQPAGCADAATTPPAADGGLCVDIDLSTYDQSCVVATDCIVILTGQVCSSECACGGSPVNAAEQARYEEATSGIAFGECACPLEIAPSCVGNTCVLPAAMPLSP
jgi:hypothetical protein